MEGDELKAENPTQCFACRSESTVVSPAGAIAAGWAYDCACCGRYVLGLDTWAMFDGMVDGSPRIQAALSYEVRRASDRKEWVFIPTELVKTIVDDPRLPTPAEQADNLIRWLAASSPAPGVFQALDPQRHRAIAGSQTDDTFFFVVDHLFDTGLLRGSKTFPSPVVMLSMAGWTRFEELSRGRVDSQKAFMAMSFRNPVLARVYHECFKPAVAQTGFTLFRIDEEPSAGLIDNRIRVEILTSRFLVADLTDGNQGAYWEAGYAEGSGKPVIYTCEHSVFESKETHFDTNHMQTVPWREDDLATAASRLKATVRATLRGEARLEDSPDATSR